MSPRLPQMASLPPPACGFDAAVVKSMMDALLPAMFAIRCGTSRLHGPGRIFIVESILDISRGSPLLYVGATATAEVGTLRLCWLRMAPETRGDSKRRACKHHLPERPMRPFSGAGGGRVSFATAAANAVRA